MKKIFTFLLALAVSVGMSWAIEGALSGEFSVSATKKVHFSKGNLQAAYDGSKWNCFFATNQWSYVGNTAANTSITGNGTVSVFSSGC